MKRKLRIKKSAKNDFSKLSGVEAFFVVREGNENDCLVSDQKKINNIPLLKYAYKLYNGYDSYSLRIKTTCGVKNCVNKAHLLATLHLNNKDKQYILDWHRINGIEYMENAFKIPAELIKKTLNI